MKKLMTLAAFSLLLCLTVVANTYTSSYLLTIPSKDETLNTKPLADEEPEEKENIKAL